MEGARSGPAMGLGGTMESPFWPPRTFRQPEVFKMPETLHRTPLNLKRRSFAKALILRCPNVQLISQIDLMSPISASLLHLFEMAITRPARAPLLLAQAQARARRSR
jgi:hypothetical protein